MKYRLFLLGEAATFLYSMKRAERDRLIRHLESISEFPPHYSQYSYRDNRGRRIEGCIVGKHAIEWWEDTAHEDLKVLSITPADGHRLPEI
ncbi:MAG: hypothetical protein K1X78_07870 [Verrucomicrobiaceae bacterium]|nr:hypothetical protein [Verrucomicrobiaceae bacterium]